MRFILLSITFILLPFVTYAAEECRWTQFAVGSSCGQVLDSDWKVKEWAQGANSKCQSMTKPSAQTDTNTLCCCHKLSSQKKPYTKIIIIGSLAAIFGVITIISFAVRKNENS